MHDKLHCTKNVSGKRAFYLKIISKKKQLYINGAGDETDVCSLKFTFSHSILIALFGFTFNFMEKKPEEFTTDTKNDLPAGIYLKFKNTTGKRCKNRSRFLSFRMLKMILKRCMREQKIPYFFSQNI